MKKNARLLAITCAALAVFIHPATAAPGDLDLTFGGTGKVVTPILSGNDGATGTAVQSDGKIVVAGYSFNGSNYDFAVVRYMDTGALDPTFGGGTGKVTTAIGSGDDLGNGVALQSDGKIVVAGYSYNGSTNEFAVVRYNTDGTLDTAFGGTGKVTADFGGSDSGTSVTMQNDGRIVVAGYTYTSGTALLFAVARYNTNGSLDTTFNGTGQVTTAVGTGNNDVASGVAVQSDGKIVVVGYSSTFSLTPNHTALVRYNADGSLDMTFGANHDGKVITAVSGSLDYGRSVTLQGDGKIVVGGTSNNGSDYDFALVRYNADGSLDTSFNGTGKVITGISSGDDTVFGVVVQSDMKIVVAGTSTEPNGNFALARYNTNGSLDTSFGGTGIVITASGGDAQCTSVALQADGKIVVAGYSLNGSNNDFTVARYLSDSGTYSGIFPAVEFVFGTAIGSNYSIEASFDLTNWATIEANISGTGGFISRLYSIRGQAKRFFRSHQN